MKRVSLLVRKLAAQAENRAREVGRAADVPYDGARFSVARVPEVKRRADWLSAVRIRE